MLLHLLQLELLLTDHLKKSVLCRIVSPSHCDLLYRAMTDYLSFLLLLQLLVQLTETWCTMVWWGGRRGSHALRACRAKGLW